METIVNNTLKCWPTVPASPWFSSRLGRLLRRLTSSNQLDPATLSPQMLRDLGLPDHLAEDPLARDKLRGLF
jgi:hypothetical protein